MSVRRRHREALCCVDGDLCFSTEMAGSVITRTNAGVFEATG